MGKMVLEGFSISPLFSYCCISPMAPFWYMLTSPQCWLLAKVISVNVLVNRAGGNKGGVLWLKHNCFSGDETELSHGTYFHFISIGNCVACWVTYWELYLSLYIDLFLFSLRRETSCIGKTAQPYMPHGAFILTRLV